MSLPRILCRLSPVLFFAIAVAAAEPLAPSPTPWGVSASASSFRDHSEWFPKMREAGVTSVRLFPEWRGFEPVKGTWKWDDGDRLIKTAADNKLEITAILMGSPPGSKTAHAFPMDNLGDWSNFVGTVVGRYKDSVRHWEVWNEGNGGFNDGKHTTADYARLVVTTHDAAKKADPRARVGLTVASFDAAYLNQAILAMKKAGKPNSFDYLCIHPYEIADGLANPDGEVPFLWMTRLLRDVLKANAPERADAEIWISEVGRRIDKRKDHPVTEADAARAFTKIYTMALAQGIARTQWFEARDPVGEEPGFGLLNRDGTPRASYRALKTLTTCLGPTPKHLGWLALGREGRGYGFVFAGKSAPVLIAWMPAGRSDRTLSFAADVELIDPQGGETRSLKAGQSLELTDAPLLVVGLPAHLVKQATENAGKNFPWGGDFSAAQSVSFQAGFPDGTSGIVPTHRADYPTVKFADGSTGILVQGDIGHPLTFQVHPSFAGILTKDYYVRWSVRRLAAGNAGMNLVYEVADSQGHSPYKNAGNWFGVTKDNGWQIFTWHVTDACFAKMWGYDFAIRPEQSIPFVIGKVEVSTVPFK